MSAASPTFAGMQLRGPIGDERRRAGHHPWRRFSELTDWTLRWAHLPAGTMGLTCHRTRTVTLAEGMDQAERRCTIAHETLHILRGPAAHNAHGHLREELTIDRRVSRLLIPSARDLVDAMSWARADTETAAAELWVDPFILEVRLSSLYAHERQRLEHRLADVLL